MEPEKDEGPATTLSFVGIELDSVAMEVCLPLEKLQRRKEALQMWRGRKVCKKRELPSLIGLLSHACKVVRAGRSFLRRLIDLSMVPKHLDHYVRLNSEAMSDMHRVVGASCGKLEWHPDDAHGKRYNSSSLSDIRRIWRLGLWSLFRYQLVHAEVGGITH